MKCKLSGLILNGFILSMNLMKSVTNHMSEKENDRLNEKKNETNLYQFQVILLTKKKN